MTTRAPRETFSEQTVTYTLEMNGDFYIVENVPARVCVETGEQLFAPETVERLQQIIRSKEGPVRVISTPVFDFAA
jgi:YgiT-type zinc finger domain-containing protein